MDLLNNFEKPENTIDHIFRWGKVDIKTVYSVVNKIIILTLKICMDFQTSYLRKFYTSLFSILTYVINLVLNDGKFPDCLKPAKITPIYKKET